MGHKQLKYIGGMVGNPILPEVEWSDEQLSVLKDLGMNFVQMNIAWDSRPAGEPLNLNDLTPDILQLLRYRMDQLNKFGMKGMPHFGMPKVKVLEHEANITPYLKPSCIMEEETYEYNISKLKELLTVIPEIDDIMFYTYDQHAWLCSQFGYCPNCAGVPLHERLIPFIERIKSEMAAINPNITFWWQPWELSLGQICKVLNNIDTSNFGLMLNTGGAESYYHNLENHWIKNIGEIAAKRNIPIIAEIQMSGSGVGTVPRQCFPCPTLVYRQIELMRKLPTLCGIKEHFGISFENISSNLLFLKEYLREFEEDSKYIELDEILERTARLYGESAVPHLVEAWKYSERGMDSIPFWFYYVLTNIAGYSPKHGFDVPRPDVVHADTPAWESDRRAFYMLTHNGDYHPWALENAALMFEVAADYFEQSLNLLKKALSCCANLKEDLEKQISDMEHMLKANRGQSLHYLQAITAYDARVAMFQRDERKLDAALKRFDRLMQMDVENQDHDNDIVEKYNEFKASPKDFFEKNYRQNEYYWAKTYISKIDQRY
jgi:hypothetical protein